MWPRLRGPQIQPARLVPVPAPPSAEQLCPYSRVRLRAYEQALVVERAEDEDDDDAKSRIGASSSLGLKHGSTNAQALEIEYGKKPTVRLGKAKRSDRGEVPTLVVDGLVGILNGFQDSYLLAVSSSRLAAPLAPFTSSASPDEAAGIYTVQQTLAIPLSSFAITRTTIEIAAAAASPSAKQNKQQQVRAKRSASLVRGVTLDEASDTETGTETETDSETDEEDALAASVPDADSLSPPTPAPASPQLRRRPGLLRLRSSTRRLSSASLARTPSASGVSSATPAQPETTPRVVEASMAHQQHPEQLAVERQLLAHNLKTETLEISTSVSNLVAAPQAATGADASHSSPAAGQASPQTNAGPSTSIADDDEAEELSASRAELDSKIVRETRAELKGMFFFRLTSHTQSRDAVIRDITRSWQDPNAVINCAGAFWQKADERFWWNRHLAEAITGAEATSETQPSSGRGASAACAFALVLSQGFVACTTVDLPVVLPTPTSGDTPAPFSTPTNNSDSVPVSILLLSRRSVERPGLRYQRRGVNAKGAVANFVETEMVTTTTRDGHKHIASFLQIRGSIPIYWSQSPWALKPPPVLERTPVESAASLARHFELVTQRYGRCIIVNLAEHEGREAAVVGAFKDAAVALDEKANVKYVEFDFHNECRGMSYSNISKLVSSLERDFECMRYFWSSDKETMATQAGVLRTNCIDCLDRTNVVQSAFARHVIQRFLTSVGLTGAGDDFDLAFNGIWADNGDAISREYAGTSALKGDFTRTGKRDWRGALNDATNSLARMWQATIADFFKQSVIDYVLGTNANAFREFEERLASSDPSELSRVADSRALAIETATKHCLEPGEELRHGWTLLSPQDPGQIKSAHFEEKIVLLSGVALYVVSYEFKLQKVRHFVRVPLDDVVQLSHGAYILSALDAATRSPLENYGFKLTYNSRRARARFNTYSMRVRPPSMSRRNTVTAGGAGTLPRLEMTRAASEPRIATLPRAASFLAVSAANAAAAASAAASAPEDDLDNDDAQERFFAFKALRSDDGRAKDAAIDIVTTISKAAQKAKVDKRDIVSVEEAKASVGLLDRMSHSLKHLIWL